MEFSPLDPSELGTITVFLVILVFEFVFYYLACGKRGEQQDGTVTLGNYRFDGSPCCCGAGGSVSGEPLGLFETRRY